MFLDLSGSHLLRQQNGNSSSRAFVLGVVPPPHFPRQKLSIECCDHTAQFHPRWQFILCMPVLEAELSEDQLLAVVEPGIPPSGRGWKDQLWWKIITNWSGLAW